VLTCRLDFLNGPLVAHLHIDARVGAQGALVTTVALSARQPDVSPANNTASVTTVVAPVGTVPTVAVLPAPRLVRKGVGNVSPLRLGAKASLTFGASLNRAARVRLTVKPLGGTRSLLLGAGSRVGPRSLTSSAFSTSSLLGAGTFSVRAVIDSRPLVRGKAYVATLVATTPDGRTSTLTQTFKG